MLPTDSPEASWSDARARWAVWSTFALAVLAVVVLVALEVTVLSGWWS